MTFSIVPQIKDFQEEILAGARQIYKRVTFSYADVNKKAIAPRVLVREILVRSDASSILLYNRKKGTVVLVRQFRLATFMSGNPDGMLIEACAGQIDGDETPEQTVIRETKEETGFIISNIEPVFEAYMSPGAVTEKLYFFLAEYDTSNRLTVGGGIDDEEIEVLELPLSQALKMIRAKTIVDAKTIMLLQHLAIKLAV